MYSCIIWSLQIAASAAQRKLSILKLLSKWYSSHIFWMTTHTYSTMHRCQHILYTCKYVRHSVTVSHFKTILFQKQKFLALRKRKQITNVSEHLENKSLIYSIMWWNVYIVVKQHKTKQKKYCKSASDFQKIQYELVKQILTNRIITIRTSFLVCFNFRSFSYSTIHRAKHAIIMPWPRSPNITANRNGKVMMVYGAAGRKKIS